MKFTLRKKLISSYIGIVTFCAAAISVPVIMIQVNDAKRNIQQAAELEIENAYSTIDTFLAMPTMSIKSAMDFISEIKSDDQKIVEDYLKRTTEGKKDYGMMYYASLTPVKDGGFITNNQNWIPPKDFDQTTRDWYARALISKQLKFSDPYVDANTNDVIVTLSQSFYNKNVLSGVIAIDLNLPTIAKIADSIKLSKSAKVFIVDKYGKYITNPDPEKIGKMNFYEEYGFEEFKQEIYTDALFVNLDVGDNYFVARRMPEVCGWSLVTFGPKMELYTRVKKSILFIIGITIISIIIAVFIGIFVTLSIVKPVSKIGSSLLFIASGNADLTNRLDIKTNDEIGDVAKGFNSFMQKMQEIVREIKISRDNLLIAGEDLSASTIDTAASIEQILANINSIHSQINSQGNSVNQTAGAVNQIAQNIESLEKLIEHQASGVVEASSTVEEMIGNISSVNSSVEKMAESFETLADDALNGSQKQEAVNERIRQIESQSQMLQEANTAISSIAEQTNLLAMNAAIEAAHAGEAGKGFSVVADEIRKLSETSADQSRTIGEQLSKIRDSIAEVVAASNESSEAFISVADKIKLTDQVVHQIKIAMEEQQEGSKQITNALQMMNDSTAEVKVSSKEMSEGNKLILDEIKKLQTATSIIQTGMDEMSNGARKINETGASLSGISDKMKQSIKYIGKEIDQFQV